MLEVARTLGLFVLAGLCEIGGGYLVWQWLRSGREVWFGLFGAGVLVLYGIVPTLQTEPNFGRVYAAYGGVFVLLALVWGAVWDQWSPDHWDILGAVIVFLGVSVILWGPRN